jgi:hypothetical protein
MMRTMWLGMGVGGVLGLLEYAWLHCFVCNTGHRFIVSSLSDICCRRYIEYQDEMMSVMIKRGCRDEKLEATAIISESSGP